MIELVLAAALKNAAVTQIEPVQAVQDTAESIERDTLPAPERGSDETAEKQSEAPAVEPAPPRQITIPAKHPIIISVEGQVGSKISQAKDRFPIKLVSPVVIEDIEVLPAGLIG